MIVDPHVEDHQDFYKYIKQNIASLQGMDQLVIDCTAVLNTDEELLAAFEMIRTMYDGIRIIIFAPDYKPGSPFLKKCLLFCLQVCISYRVRADIPKKCHIHAQYNHSDRHCKF